MKNILKILLVFGVFQSYSQEKLDDYSKIKWNMNQQEVSWNQGDINGFMHYYWNNDSLMFIGSKGVTYGWKATRDNYISGYPDKAAMGKLSFEVLKLDQLSDVSFSMAGKWALTREIGDVSGCFLLIWKKIDDKWVIVCDHTS
jgi:hypothetical protein